MFGAANAASDIQEQEQAVSDVSSRHHQSAKGDVSSTTEETREAQRALAVDFKTPFNGNSAELLKGKTLLITGGASGFGEAIVKGFTKSPNTAAVIAKNNSERGETLERSLREAGRKVKFVQVDVTDWSSVISLFRSALSWLRKSYGRDQTIDHVVTCAGVVSPNLDLAPVRPDEFLDTDNHFEPPPSRSINISIMGTMYTVTAAMRFAMGLHEESTIQERSDKSITMLSSMSGYSGTPLQSDYTASKWGVRGFWRSLLDDGQVTPSPVRFNLIAPYFVATPLTEAYVPYMQGIGIKLGDISDVEATALRFICDKTIYGRAAGVWHGGASDLGDDLGGGFGATALCKGVESGALRQSGVHITKKRGVS